MHKQKNKPKAHPLQVAAAALFWIAVWQVASMAINEVLFLPSPLQVALALGEMAATPVFWLSIGQSLVRIALGFFLGLVVGCALAALAAAYKPVEILLRPLLMLMRAAPVASFIILALLWVSTAWLSTFISFLMVMPILYNATYSGIKAADVRLLEMAQVFKIGLWRRIRAIYLPALRPSLPSACELALGMCWKSGVAAEVIGLPSGSIGERLYMTKIFLMTPEMFGWTAVIILLSWLFGRVVQALLAMGVSTLEKVGKS